MTKTAWVFPGQGSQAIGMGAGLFDLPAAQQRFEQAAEILGWSVPEICQSEDDKVSKTLYTQPCLYTIESILVDLLREKGLQPSLVAGHSLGEYVALYAAQVFEFESGLRLVKRRAALMDSASEGMMAALLGFDRAQLEAAIAQTPDVVLANDNNEGQVVISGTPSAVEAIMSGVKCKRAVKLNVSGAFHSPLMAEAAAEFRTVLDSVAFQTAQVPVLSNVDPTPATDAAVLKDRLDRQMTGSVRWREISLQLSQAGIERVIEVGPGKVLTGIIKRTCPDVALENVGAIADIERVAA
ncbi:ACP S-malonyltransferase [Thermoleptolyngbya sp. C42_A2020_037]|uniref:ACP S-malonyltransferase n=1 Tax=Thermoleptolyngbya sp. C42_A2020_037 TaxID=2747799 RepID=UPI0019E7792F|nr:ACP S-malonyltransferase [Thermoleptolyngbya sp. C42_A2020_037]MBF2085133.1 ACP S-malonyltransferase [Thermoleptolyngbya sp. C42_A2020_037]